jgi:hypothetical protein
MWRWVRDLDDLAKKILPFLFEIAQAESYTVLTVRPAFQSSSVCSLNRICVWELFQRRK